MTDPGTEPIRRPTGLLMAWTWFRLGLLSIGSTAAQIDLIEQEIVYRRRWISPAQFRRLVQSALALPGPETPQLAAYAGWLLGGVGSGILAGLLLLLPGLLIMLTASVVYLLQGQAPEIQALLYGLKPAILAAVLAGCIRLAQRTLTRPRWILVSVLSGLLVVANAPLLLILSLAAMTGLGIALLAKDGDGGLNTFTQEDSPHYWLSLHPRPCSRPPSRFARSWPLAVAVCIWALSIGAMGWAPGAVLQDLALLFSQMAVMTFSSTYAVLPTMLQIAVEERGWLEASQLMDGLALAESTPGPVALIHVFIGAVSAASHISLLDFPVWQAAMAGGLVGGIFTFMPSLLIILAIAPWLETHQSLDWLQLIIRAVGAAVVAVILQLGVSFGVQVIWPEGLIDFESAWRGADLMAAGLALASLYLLLSRRWAFGLVLVLSIFLGAILAWAGFTGLEDVQFTPIIPASS